MPSGTAVKVAPLARALAELHRAIARVRDAVDAATSDQAVELARATDQLAGLTAAALASSDGLERSAGMPERMALSNAARLSHQDARAHLMVRDALAHMPKLRALVTSGRVSYSQARHIARESHGVPAPQRAALDEFIAARAPMATRAEPEHLIWQVGCEVTRLRTAELAKRERSAHERRFVWVQPSLVDGSARLFAQGPLADIATMVAAADTFAPRPVDANDPDAPSRGAQRFDGLVESAIAALGGAGGRAKPRITLTYRAEDLTDPGKNSGASVLWAHPGTPPSISKELAEMLACDADIVPVLFDGAKPVAVGTTTKTIPDKVRTAVLARDGGCRFPSCGAPVEWCDVHHAMPGIHDPALCMALCRRCHRRIHNGPWRIRPKPDGVIEFRHRGQVYESLPRFAPARE